MGRVNGSKLLLILSWAGLGTGGRGYHVRGRGTSGVDLKVCWCVGKDGTCKCVRTPSHFELSWFGMGGRGYYVRGWGTSGVDFKACWCVGKDGTCKCVRTPSREATTNQCYLLGYELTWWVQVDLVRVDFGTSCLCTSWVQVDSELT